MSEENILDESERDDIIDHSGVDKLITDDYPHWLWDRLEWFQDLKFGLFMHWGIYCQWNCIESWPLSREDTWARPDGLDCWEERDRDLARFRKDYWALNKQFNPVDFDPKPWVDAAKYAGMKYVNLTTKHHDGFCMWDTRTTDFRITHPDCPFHSDPRADIVRQVYDTFREEGFSVSCYFSKSDWKSPYYWNPERKAPDRNPNYDTAAEPERWEKFVQYVHAQIRELMSNYGKIDVLWLDGGQVRPPKQDIRMDEIAEMGRSLQPGLIIADRTVGGRHENIITPEQKIPSKPLSHPWESCITMSDGWSYTQNENYKSTRELIHMLVEIVAKGGNLLLNVAPTPLGTYTEGVYQRLREIGDWMQVNSDAIYGTRPIAPYSCGNVRFTQKDNNVYAIVLNDKDTPGQVIWNGLPPVTGSEMILLENNLPLSWVQEGEKTIVSLPDNLNSENIHAQVFKFRI